MVEFENVTLCELTTRNNDKRVPSIMLSSRLQLSKSKSYDRLYFVSGFEMATPQLKTDNPEIVMGHSMSNQRKIKSTLLRF